MTLKDVREKLQEMNLEAKAAICDDLSSIQQNPDIQMICTSPRCFKISSIKLGEGLILDPTYYDFKLQRDILLSCLNRKKTLEECQAFLQRAVKKQKIAQSNKYCTLHPVVLGKIQDILNELA